MCALNNTNKMAYFYAACEVHGTIFSTASKFQIYVVTRSYSGCLFFCILVIIRVPHDSLVTSSPPNFVTFHMESWNKESLCKGLEWSFWKQGLG